MASVCFAGSSSAQTGISQLPIEFASQNESPSLALTADKRVHISIDFLASDYRDLSQAALGHDHQGRIGWIIVALSGNLNPHTSYTFEINPVNDAATPLPACGEPDFFFPNVPDAVGPPVVCDPDGRDRVDLYRFVGLDPITQQGSVRQAVVDFHTSTRGLGVRFGRFILPIGFRWDEVGSWTNLDATLIQRLNAESNFGFAVYGLVERSHRPVIVWQLAAIRGDGNRAREYSYSGFVNNSWDTNSFMTGIAAVTMSPAENLDLRVSGRYGFSGSKVERYPSFYFTKRNDQGLVISGRYRPNAHLTVFGEYAYYLSGLMDSSAKLLGLTPARVPKAGFYLGADLSRSVTSKLKVGSVITAERISRNDSLVWYLAENGLYGVRLGEHVRSLTFRFNARWSEHLEFGFYRNQFENPFPWVSGIQPVAGPRAFQGPPNHKYGTVVRLRLP